MSIANTNRGVLGVVFAFFLGLMITAFVGVGVYTFYPPPQNALADRLEDLSRRERDLRDAQPAGGLTEADRQEVLALNAQRDRVVDEMEAARRGWGRTTSIILIAFATLAMAASLGAAGRVPVIDSGLLMGGVFTMVYGVGWVVATDGSVARFVVMTVALAITLALGYLRFVRRRPRVKAVAAAGPVNAEGLTELERRVARLEARLHDAASVLGRDRTGSS